MSRYFEIFYPCNTEVVSTREKLYTLKKKKKQVGLSRNTTYFDPTYNWWPLIFQRIHHFDRGKEQHKPSMVNNALKHGHRVEGRYIAKCILKRDFRVDTMYTCNV